MSWTLETPPKNSQEMLPSSPVIFLLIFRIAFLYSAISLLHTLSISTAAGTDRTTAELTDLLNPVRKFRNINLDTIQTELFFLHRGYIVTVESLFHSIFLLKNIKILNKKILDIVHEIWSHLVVPSSDILLEGLLFFLLYLLQHYGHQWYYVWLLFCKYCQLLVFYFEFNYF